MKTMLQQYGPVFVGTYGTLYLSTLALFFVGVESGTLDPVLLFQWLGQTQDPSGGTAAESTVDLVVEFMQNHTWTQPYAHVMEKNPSVANLAVAWIAVKFTEPIRLALSVAVTPRLARYFGYGSSSQPETEDNDADDKIVRDHAYQHEASEVAESKENPLKADAETTTLYTKNSGISNSKP